MTSFSFRDILVKFLNQKYFPQLLPSELDSEDTIDCVGGMSLVWRVIIQLNNAAAGDLR